MIIFAWAIKAIRLLFACLLFCLRLVLRVPRLMLTVLAAAMRGLGPAPRNVGQIDPDNPIVWVAEEKSEKAEKAEKAEKD